MKRSLTILLIDDCQITSVRFVELLQDTPNVDVVFFAKDLSKGVAMFQVRKIDVLILVTHVANEELEKLAQLCKTFECKVIVLSEYTHVTYKKVCEKLGIQLLDKTSEAGRIAEELKKISER